MKKDPLLQAFDAIPAWKKWAAALGIGAALGLLDAVGIQLGRWLFNGIAGILLMLVAIAGIGSAIALIVRRL